MPQKAKKSAKRDFTQTVGRRKTASSRVRLFRGKGESSVNGKPRSVYFPGQILEDLFMKPFRVLDVSDKFYVTVKVVGGGLKAQAEATGNAIAKTLAKLNPDEYRIPLKKAGLLTRDPRVRERRKVNTGGKARRKKQSPKR